MSGSVCIGMIGRLVDDVSDDVSKYKPPALHIFEWQVKWFSTGPEKCGVMYGVLNE